MAIFSETIIFIGQHLPIIVVLGIIYHLTCNYLTPGASSIPGPFWAKLSHIWRFLDVARGRADVTLYKLHQKYGEYVRLGPNVVSVRNLDAVRTVYSINKRYKKTGFYRVQQQLSKGRPTQTLFTTLDEDFHESIKRPVSSAYSMSTLTEFEPFVDNTIQTLFTRLDEFAANGEVCDIATWLQYYAFDVIGELTFSKPLGFLEQGRDVDGIIGALEKTLDYAGKIGQMPWLDYLFVKNPLKQLLPGGPTTPVARFARARLNERLQDINDTSSPPRRDFLTRFLEAKKNYPEIVDDAQVFSYTVSNMNAGSDTTAISLRAVLYYMLKNPRVHAKLRRELQEALTTGKISSPVSWKQSQDQHSIPYLDAVIKESLRLHPAVGLLLERIVPRDGLRLPNGVFLPGGTIVGANPWILHRDPAVFGTDVDVFRPERWLRGEEESEMEFKARRLEMGRATLTFGAGKRTCIGKNISLLEMYKLIPSLVLNYHIELVNPLAEWEVVNAWFVRQKNMDVRLVRTSHP